MKRAAVLILVLAFFAIIIRYSDTHQSTMTFTQKESEKSNVTLKDLAENIFEVTE